MGINLQDVIFNPSSHDRMEVPQQFHMVTFHLAQPLVILDICPEPLVLLLVERMGRTPAGSTSFLALEMDVGVGFEILHQKRMRTPSPLW